MASPLSLKVDVDMSALIRAAQQSGMSVDDLAAAFDGVESSAQAAASQSSTGLSTISGDARTAASGVGTVGDAAGTAEGALSSLGSAGAAALSGDIEGGVQGALSSLGGMAAAVGIGGPVGGAILGALGEAVGAWIAELDLFAQKTAEIKDEVSNSLVEAGGAFDAAGLESRIQQVVTDTESWAAAQTIAKATGLDLGTVVAGLAGDADAAAASSKALKSAMDDIGNTENPAAWIPTKDLWAAQQAIDGVTQGLGSAPAKMNAYNAAMKQVQSSSQDASKQVNIAAEALEAVPANTVANMKINLDDSKLRNYRPPTIQVPAQVIVRPGQVQYTG